MNFPAAEVLLERLGNEKHIHYSLENIKAALKEAGNPEKTVKSIVIAGTNGKGTTTLLISRALQLQGLRVSTTLSPHLQSIRERFLDGLVPWSVERLENSLKGVLPLVQKYQLSYFEALILAFFMDSSQHRPDFNVIEVGMGGRLDATNVTEPFGVILTNISWDHADFLGDSLEKILKEKMGVFRKNTPVITGIAPSNPLFSILRKECESLSSPLSSAEEVSRKVISKSWSGQHVEIDHEPFFLKNPASYFLENAATAYCFLRKCFPEISLKTIQDAFSSVSHPGRLELVQENPKIILSGDHNEAGIESLIQTLKELGTENLFILCGFSPDKNAKKMTEALLPMSKKLLLTRVPRARGDYSEDYFKIASFEEEPRIALERMTREMGADDILLITGSLYLIGALRDFWKKEVGFI